MNVETIHDGRIAKQVRIPHSFILAILLLLAGVSFLTLSVAFNARAMHISLIVITTFVLNLIIALICLIVESLRYPYSITQVHWLFIIIFFCVAPVSHYLNGYKCWGYHLSDDTYVQTNLHVLLWESVFAVVNARRVSFKDALVIGNLGGRVAPKAGDRRRTWLLITSLSCVILTIVLVGFGNLFSRMTYGFSFVSSTNLIVYQVSRSFPVAALAILYTSGNEDRSRDLLVIFAFLMVVLVDSPLSMSRYLMGAFWGGLALLTLPSFRTRRGLFPLAFLAVFLIVFPVSNVFRRQGASLDGVILAVKYSFLGISEGFNTGDYDAFSMLARATMYVREHGISWGRQLVTALLFFVPRTMWPGKGVGSGYTIAQAQGQAFLNVSCPLPAEGIVNYGFVGLVLFAIVFALIARLIDKSFWVDRRSWSPLYPFVCMYTFFIMRGDFLSSFSYTTGFIASFALAHIICYGLGEDC